MKPARFFLILCFLSSAALMAKAQVQGSPAAAQGENGCVPAGETCDKDTMMSDGIVRLSEIEVYPEYLEEYAAYAAEVGEISLATEPGVLTMYALKDKDNPCRITILETYSNREAYEKHIASEHFRKYKLSTLKMVKSPCLRDQTPLNPGNRIINFAEQKP